MRRCAGAIIAVAHVHTPIRPLLYHLRPPKHATCNRDVAVPHAVPEDFTVRTRPGWIALALLVALVPVPAHAQLPYAESFDGPDGAPWPAPWTTMSFYITVHDLQGNRARMSGQAANGSGAYVARMLLPGFAATDIEAVMTLEFEDVAHQGIGFYARQNGGTLVEYLPHGQGYALFLKGGWGWPEDLGIWREIDGTETQFATGYNPVAGGLQNGVRYRVRYRVGQHAADSTLIQARVWPEASAEPVAWTVVTFDTQPQLQGTAGGFALDVYNFQGTAHVFVDDLEIRPWPHPLSAAAPATAPRIALATPWPHPVAGPARVGCALPGAGRARIGLFDAAGRRVAEVFDGVLDAGASTLPWRPVDAAGRRLPAGVYLMRLEAGGATAVRRIVVTG